MAKTDKAVRARVEQAVREVAPLLASHLRRRYRALSADHDDLVQQTLTDLLEYLHARARGLPPLTEISALAFAILKRRVADRFRDATRRAAQAAETGEFDPVSQAPALDAHLRYRRLLWAVMHLLAELDPGDRNLLLREEMPTQEPVRALSSAERKRLSRLRERLRAALQARFGMSPVDYLGG